MISYGEVRAHFLWLICEREYQPRRAVCEGVSQRDARSRGTEFLKHIEKAKITADGHTLSWSKQEDAYGVNLPKATPAVIDGFCDMGVMKRGDQTFRLLYTARVRLEPSNASDPESGDLLRARLVTGRARAGRGGLLSRQAGPGRRRQSVS